MSNIFIKRKKYRILFITIIFAVGLYDQVPIEPLYPYDTSYSEIQSNYEDFFGRVEANVDSGDMVYQLPFMYFPENCPVFELGDYGHFKGYLFTNTIKWSYGAIRGVDTEAESLNIGEGMNEAFLEGLIDAGFSGVYIDTDGYKDKGEKILTYYNNRGLSPIVSKDGKLYFYNIKHLKIDRVLAKKERTEGYSFIKGFADKCNIKVSVDNFVEYAIALNKNPEYASKGVYKWLVSYGSDNMDNKEYISFLYQNVLGRSKVDVEDNDGWVRALNQGMERLDVLTSFLSSPEFRARNGIRG